MARVTADSMSAVAAPAASVRRELITGSTRRILWIVGLFRAVCGALLLGLALMLDLRAMNVDAPNSFLTAASLYFVFGLAAFGWIQQERMHLPLTQTLFALVSGDILFIALMMIAGGSTGAPLPILLFPQLAASGWLLRTQTAFFHAALAAIVLLSLEAYRALGGDIRGPQLFQTALISLGYFAMVGIAVVIGRYTTASEELATQRGIDVANLEQVNRLIIQDMQDGVLVVDLNGVVRGHNAQVTRLLGGFGRMRGGMRIGTGLNGGTLIYLEDLGRAQTEAQQMKLAAMGRLTASIAHEVRNPLSAINQAAQLLEEDRAVAPEGERLLSMIRNNAKRIDRIVGEVLQLNRRDRQQPEVIPLRDFVRSIADEIVQAEGIPPGSLVIDISDDLMVVFDRGHLNQIAWNLVRNAWQHCQKRSSSIGITARAGYMGDAVICELTDDGPGVPAEFRAQIFEPFFTTRSGGTGLGLYIARELADANGAALELLPKSPGAVFRITLKRALTPAAA